jgi:hypothetical protein
MKEIVYISGPIAGYDREERMKAFAAAEENVREIWYNPNIVNPMTLEEPLDQTWYGYLRRDLEFLELCSGMYVLNGWQESRGSLLELKYTVKTGLPKIVLENPWSIYVMKKNGKRLSEEKAREYFEDPRFICPDDMNILIKQNGAFNYFLSPNDPFKEGTKLEVTFNLAALNTGLIKEL